MDASAWRILERNVPSYRRFGTERIVAEVENLAANLRGLLGEGGEGKLETMVVNTKKMV